MSAETINGARIVLETLHRLGVTDMFGYPGGAVIPIYDEIYSFPEIKHYFVRHEQGAAHAADGYARVSGQSWRMSCYVWSWCNESCNRYYDCVHGFRTYGGHYWSGWSALYR